jgi:hypothetical protein
MGLEADQYALTTSLTRRLANTLPSGFGPGHFGEGINRRRLGAVEHGRIRQDTIAKFMNMDLFFVKLSDVLFIIPGIPHLRNIKLSVNYRELPENEDSLRTLVPPPAVKWKTDPDAARYLGFHPRAKHYINGALVGEDLPQFAIISPHEFPEHRVPRRNFCAVSPDDPEYALLCREQGLEHLLHDGPSRQSPALLNGVHGTPSPKTIPIPHEHSISPTQTLPVLVNGIHASEERHQPATAAAHTNGEAQHGNN